MRRKGSGLGRVVPVVLLALSMPDAARADAAAAQGFQGFTKVLYDKQAYEVRADGTATETREWAMKVLTEQGLSSANETSLSHSEQLQTAEILAAYTIKPDGRRIDAPKSNYQVSSNAGHGDAAPMFSDIQTDSVVFPEVSVGDTVVFSYRLTDKEAMFPGQFSFARSFSKFQIVDDTGITLVAPDTLALRILARDVEGGKVQGGAGQNRWEWHYRNQQLAQPESGAVSSFDYGPLVAATTFQDYAAIAAAYQSRARDKSEITPRIHELAESLTASDTTPRDKAKALYEWVSKNIKFAGHCVGNGSVVPHPADQVLANRLGDCKDHTALMQALLADRGIASTPALIGSGSAYGLPDVPTVQLFDHVINYIPSLDLYADSTAEDVPFGSLPSSEYGKPVLHTADFKGISRTPPPPRNDRYETRTRIDFAADGSATGRSDVEIHGPHAADARSKFGYLQPNLEDLAVRRMLGSNGFSGTGTIVRPALDGPADQALYGYEFSIRDVLDLPGPAAWGIRSPFGSFMPYGAMQAAINAPPRTVDYLCAGYQTSERYSLKLPKGVHLLATPRDRRIDSPMASYRAHYSNRGGVLTVERELDDRTPGPTCTPRDAENYRVFAAAVIKDLRTSLLYR